MSKWADTHIARFARASQSFALRIFAADLKSELEGRQTAALSVEIFRLPIPLDWAEQCLMLGFVD